MLEKNLIIHKFFHLDLLVISYKKQLDESEEFLNSIYMKLILILLINLPFKEK